MLIFIEGDALRELGRMLSELRGGIHQKVELDLENGDGLNVRVWESGNGYIFCYNLKPEDAVVMHE